MNDNGGREDAPESWCDDCVHFRHATPYEIQRKGFNPCAKKHQMLFWVPRPHEGPETFGYYMEVCADRQARPESPPPPPPPPTDWRDPRYRQTPPPRGKKPKAIR